MSTARETARQAAYNAAVGIFNAYSEAAVKAAKASEAAEVVAYDAIGTEDEDYYQQEAIDADTAAETACELAEAAAEDIKEAAK